jgi:putative membrane protein
VSSRSHLARRLLWIFYLVMWAGGLASYLILGGVRPGDEWAAPLFLTMAAAVVLVSAEPRTAGALLAAGVLGFAAEWVGLTGGWLFGRYTYTPVLGPSVFGVPLVMVSAWLVLAAYVHTLVALLRLPAPSAVAAGAGLLTAMDLVIDPLAAGPLGYWRWLDDGGFYGVPAHNFAGWFVTGAVVLAVLRMAGAAQPAGSAALQVGLSVLVFFTILAAGFGLVVPAAAGLGVSLLHTLVTRHGAVVLHPHRPEATAP